MHSDLSLMLIGCGLHAKNMYLPLIKELDRVNIIVVVDVESKREKVKFLLDSYEVDHIHTIFIPQPIDSKEFVLTDALRLKLDSAVKDYSIDGVIISSEPLSHKAYIEWALSSNLHVLIDKPIVVHTDASTSPEKARRILEDYDTLADLYKTQLASNPSLIASCLAQRRYHPAMSFIKSNILEVFQKTKCPVTSMTFYHADGQWRLPAENNHENYHGFLDGYGKASHSGYHFFDLLAWYSSETLQEKNITHALIYSDFIRPMDFEYQQRNTSYETLLSEDYPSYVANLPINNTNPTGEIDANVSISLMSHDYKVTLANIFLLHNSFSNRSWLHSREDLYKSNGRVKHESYFINLGPYQTIQYHCYQGVDDSRPLTKDDPLVGPGTTLHSEVIIYRNHKLVGGKNVEIKSFGPDTEQNIPFYKGHRFGARKKCFEEFLGGIRGEVKPSDLQSSLLSHRSGTILLSGVYQSAAKSYVGQDSVIKIPYENIL